LQAAVLKPAALRQLRQLAAELELSKVEQPISQRLTNESHIGNVSGNDQDAIACHARMRESTRGGLVTDAINAA
jgi:hypothetical protein